MKKIVFTLEVLLMLGALPFFCGMALGRENHATEKMPQVSMDAAKQSAEAIVVKPVILKNS